MEGNYGEGQPPEPGEIRPLPSDEPAPEIHDGGPSQSWAEGEAPPPEAGTSPQPADGTLPLYGVDPSQRAAGGEQAQPAGDVPPLPGTQVYGSAAPGDDVLTGGYWPPPPPGNLPPPPAGYGHGGYGSYGSGYGAYGGGYGGYGGWPGAPPRRRGRALLVIAVVAIVAAAAGVVGTLAYRNTGNSQPGGTSGPGAGSVPQPGTQRPPLNNTGVSKLNVAAIARDVNPSVVDITSNITEGQSVSAQGTGIILNPHGLVLTNNHVIADASKVTAQVAGTSQTYPVTVLGTDVTGDVALLQMQGASGLKAASFADSTKVAVGDGVVDLGNACGQGGTPTVTSGAITALNRSISASDSGSGQNSESLHGMMQTDAAITEGDSGGPLVNGAGQVVGMITAAEGSSGGCQQTSNIGFAIPVDTALSIARQIAAGHGSSTIQVGPRAGLGVTVEDASSAAQGGRQGPGGGPGGGLGPGSGSGLGSGYSPPVNSGALVIQVVQGSPAQTAGLTSGDVIASLNGNSIASSTALSQALAKFHPGDHVTVGYVDSSGRHHSAALTLGTVPPA